MTVSTVDRGVHTSVHTTVHVSVTRNFSFTIQPNVGMIFATFLASVHMTVQTSVHGTVQFFSMCTGLLITVHTNVQHFTVWTPDRITAGRFCLWWLITGFLWLSIWYFSTAGARNEINDLKEKYKISDHIPTTYWPHTNHILRTYQPHTVPTTNWLPLPTRLTLVHYYHNKGIHSIKAARCLHVLWEWSRIPMACVLPVSSTWA